MLSEIPAYGFYTNIFKNFVSGYLNENRNGELFRCSGRESGLYFRNHFPEWCSLQGKSFMSRMKEENIMRINEFAAICPVIGPTAATALEYGRIKNILKHNGTPIPENDIWIAALASQFDFPIVTRDEHFKRIEGIALLQT
jgi:hypothetical protein